MWFKNLRIYRFTKECDLSVETLEGALSKMHFKPCTNMDFSRYGWVPPLGRESGVYAHSCSGYTMICARKQEKILPPTAINEMLEEKVTELESAQARTLYRKEKQTLKEELVHTLLPRALTRSFLIHAYLDARQNLLIIDSSSPTKAEEFMEHLRASLGSLPVVPLKCHGDTANIMTNWLQNGTPDAFSLDNECELQSSRESKNTVHCKNQELECNEIMNHIKAGKRVIQLALNWQDSISFVLSDDFSIKRLRFEEIVQEQARGDDVSKAILFDQDFAVMSLQLNQLIQALLEAFGGVEKPG